MLGSTSSGRRDLLAAGEAVGLGQALGQHGKAGGIGVAGFEGVVEVLAPAEGFHELLVGLFYFLEIAVLVYYHRPGIDRQIDQREHDGVGEYVVAQDQAPTEPLAKVWNMKSFSEFISLNIYFRMRWLRQAQPRQLRLDRMRRHGIPTMRPPSHLQKVKTHAAS